VVPEVGISESRHVEVGKVLDSSPPRGEKLMKLPESLHLAKKRDPRSRQLLEGRHELWG
jgi:hypothetical protein